MIFENLLKSDIIKKTKFKGGLKFEAYSKV